MLLGVFIMFQNDLTFYDKQKFMHLSRWFDNVSNQVSTSCCDPHLSVNFSSVSYFFPFSLYIKSFRL